MIERRVSLDGLAYTYPEFVSSWDPRQVNEMWHSVGLVASESASSHKMLHATDNAKSQEALAKSQDDEDDTAAEATHQSIVVQIEKQPHTAIKEIFKSLNANCTFDDDLGSWQFQTQLVRKQRLFCGSLIGSK